MKKLIALLPLLSVASPLVSSFNHSHSATNVSIINVNQDVKTWKQEAKKTTAQQFVNHFSILKTKYGWSAQKSQIASFHFSVNDNGTFFGAYLELRSSHNTTANFYIKYDSKVTYNINNWKVQNLPTFTNEQSIWNKGFTSWINRMGSDHQKKDVLSQKLCQYWFNEVYIPNRKPNTNDLTNNSVILIQLKGRDNFLNKFYTAFDPQSITITPNTITGRIDVAYPLHSFHIYYILHYTAGRAFNYEQIVPDKNKNIDWIAG